MLVVLVFNYICKTFAIFLFCTYYIKACTSIYRDGKTIPKAVEVLLMLLMMMNCLELMLELELLVLLDEGVDAVNHLLDQLDLAVAQSTQKQICKI